MDGHWEDGKRHGGFIFTFPNGERWKFNIFKFFNANMFQIPGNLPERGQARWLAEN